MILTYIFTCIITMMIAGYFADGITFRWSFMYKLRDKVFIKSIMKNPLTKSREKVYFLARKPFSCGGCMAMWLTLIPLCVLFPAYTVWGINIAIIPALINYVLMKIIEVRIN